MLHTLDTKQTHTDKEKLPITKARVSNKNKQREEAPEITSTIFQLYNMNNMK